MINTANLRHTLVVRSIPMTTNERLIAIYYLSNETSVMGRCDGPRWKDARNDSDEIGGCKMRESVIERAVKAEDGRRTITTDVKMC